MTRRGLIVALGLLGLMGCASRTSLWVFTAPWDVRSDSALAAGVAPRATIVSGWIALDSAGGAPRTLFLDTLAAGRVRSGPRFALVTSYLGDRFHPEAVRLLGADPVRRARVADEVEAQIRAGAYDGVVLDLEALEVRDTLDLALVAGALAAAARRGGAREVALAVPALDTLAFAPRHLLPRVDRLLVMLYDQHWPGSAPGPVAAREWAQAALAQWVALAGADRVVAALPVYGYHWRPDAPTDVVGWQDVQRLARESGAPIERDAPSGSLRVQMGTRGEAWLTDGPLLAQMVADARSLGVRTIALWRLGLEDPAVWSALGAR
jgi:peptidoglycan-N-acetylglucosamine deacetylase